jgi:hypothetical protein
VDTHLFHWLKKQFSTLAVFGVPNFQSRFEALKDVFWGFGAQVNARGTNLGQSIFFYSRLDLLNGLSCA